MAPGKKLRESEQRWVDIVEFIPDATFVIDLRGKVIAWNHAMEEMTGVAAKEILGKENYEYALPFYGERRPVLIDLVNKPDDSIERNYEVLKRENSLLICETEIPNLRGHRVCLWGKASILYNEGGDINGAIETIRDVTSYKTFEKGVRKKGEEQDLRHEGIGDSKTVLSALLRKRATEQQILKEPLASSVNVAIMPQIEKLKKNLNGKNALLQVNPLDEPLDEFMSVFVDNLSMSCGNLTDKEIQIATLANEGKATKEIIDILGISESSFNMYRYDMRKKLNLAKKQNSKTYL